MNKPLMNNENPFLGKNFKIPIIAGPTAVGKTALSIQLAEELNGEIISADSRQIYRPLTIGTAKPTTNELKRVRHHFINELELDEPFSAGRFAKSAELRIQQILEEGKLPIVVGGSTLYLYALQFGLADIPEIPPQVRKDLEYQLQREGKDMMFNRLRSIDPESAQTLDPTKTQRLIRALEVYESTGRTLSSFQAEKKKPLFSYQTYVLSRPRAALYDRINRRVDLMLEAGLINEVRNILNIHPQAASNALRTIGYHEVIDFLRDETVYAEMVRLIKRNSRRYAKRQITWFRRFSEFEWIDVSSFAITAFLIGKMPVYE